MHAPIGAYIAETKRLEEEKKRLLTKSAYDTDEEEDNMCKTLFCCFFKKEESAMSRIERERAKEVLPASPAVEWSKVGKSPLALNGIIMPVHDTRPKSVRYGDMPAVIDSPKPKI